MEEEATMGQLKGAKEYRQWQEGKSLTRKQAMLAQCYTCNGFEDSREDCRCMASCPLYQYHPYKGY